MHNCYGGLIRPCDLDEAKASLIAELKSRGNNAFKHKRLMEADVLYSKVPLFFVVSNLALIFRDHPFIR